MRRIDGFATLSIAGDGCVDSAAGCGLTAGAVADGRFGGISGCAPSIGIGAPVATDSNAPMSMPPTADRARSRPIASWALIGGSFCGSNNGEGNGAPAGAGGTLLPLL